MISQGLITVAGQGPKDSNGAGKSSFIAGLSLLHADDQWKLASGAAGAADLLFTAELAAAGDALLQRRPRLHHRGVRRPGRGHRGGADRQRPDGLAPDQPQGALPRPALAGRPLPTRAPGAARGPGRRHVAGPAGATGGRFPCQPAVAVLFGGQARCVSFLSTSVRSSPTPNLLAQPLNDLSTARIFDAIANLTGLDPELEQEQALRSKEHAHRVEVLDAERDLETWQPRSRSSRPGSRSAAAPAIGRGPGGLAEPLRPASHRRRARAQPFGRDRPPGRRGAERAAAGTARRSRPERRRVVPPSAGPGRAGPS